MLSSAVQIQVYDKYIHTKPFLINDFRKYHVPQHRAKKIFIKTANESDSGTRLASLCSAIASCVTSRDLREYCKNGVKNCACRATSLKKKSRKCKKVIFYPKSSIYHIPTYIFW